MGTKQDTVKRKKKVPARDTALKEFLEHHQLRKAPEPVSQELDPKELLAKLILVRR